MLRAIILAQFWCYLHRDLQRLLTQDHARSQDFFGRVGALFELKKVLKKTAKMHYLNIFFKKFNKPCFTSSRVWRQNTLCWEFWENFENFRWKFYGKFEFLFYFPFRKFVSKNRTFGSNTFFYTIFFGFGAGGFPLPPWLRPCPGPVITTKCQRDPHTQENLVFYFGSILNSIAKDFSKEICKSKFQKFLSSPCILFFAYIQWYFVFNLFTFPISIRSQISLIFYSKSLARISRFHSHFSGF